MGHQMIEDLQDTYPGAGTFKLGEDAETSAALIALVRAKAKHAECAALAEFGGDEASMPRSGVAILLRIGTERQRW